jgi:hypothetical protein
MHGSVCTDYTGWPRPGLYVQLSHCTSLSGIILLWRARERDVVGNTIPENMAEAERRLEQLSEAAIRDVRCVCVCVCI